MDEGEIAALREATPRHRGVDAWIGAALEWELVRRDLAAVAGAAEAAVAAARTATDQPRLAPTPALRLWLRRDTSARADDELPSLCLPARVMMRVPAHDLVGLVRAALPHAETADLIDRAAAGEGMVLEVWALRAALRAMSGAATSTLDPSARQEPGIAQVIERLGPVPQVR